MVSQILIDVTTPTERPQSTPRRLSRQVAADAVAIGDILSVVLGGLLPALIYAVVGNVFLDQLIVLQSTLLAGFIAHLCLRFRGLYDTTHMDAFPQKPLELFIAVACGLVGVLGIGLPLVLRNVDIVVWYAAWMSASFTLILANRMVARVLIKRLAAAGRFDQRIAVYGAGMIARRVHDYLNAPRLGVFFSGVYDDRAGENRVNPEGLSVSGQLDELISECREGRVDAVIVALPPSADTRLAEIVAKFDKLPVSTHVVTHMTSDLLDADIAYNVSNLGPIGLLDVKKKTLVDWAPITKRLEDLTIGSVIFLVSLPLWIVIAAAIKLESTGPVFFRQRRRGRHQTTIEMLKFRTMTVMEDGDVVRQAVRGDSRVTRVGRILRRTSLDELPQIINVLKGEMSVVGPRPHAIAHDEEFSRILAVYPNRHQMRPGMTGLAQVTGLRGSTAQPGSIEARVEADMTYIANWSLWLDLKILFKTVWAVVAGTNAD